MTNLLCSVVVSLVTNTTEELPKVFVATGCDHVQQWNGFGGFGVGCTVGHGKFVDDANAREKTIRTVCTEVTTLRFDWNGARELVQERVVWESNVVMRLEWAPSGAPTSVGANVGSVTNAGLLKVLTNLVLRAEDLIIWNGNGDSSSGGLAR